MSYPRIDSSTKEERFEYIKKTYRCIAALKGKTPEVAFQDYIDGVAEYPEVAARYR